MAKHKKLPRKINTTSFVIEFETFENIKFYYDIFGLTHRPNLAEVFHDYNLEWLNPCFDAAKEFFENWIGGGTLRIIKMQDEILLDAAGYTQDYKKTKIVVNEHIIEPKPTFI